MRKMSLMRSDLMSLSSYQTTAEAIRSIHISADPFAKAREINAQQFRPKEKAPNGTQQRESETSISE